MRRKGSTQAEKIISEFLITIHHISVLFKKDLNFLLKDSKVTATR